MNEKHPIYKNTKGGYTILEHYCTKLCYSKERGTFGKKSKKKKYIIYASIVAIYIVVMLVIFVFIPLFFA